MATMAEIDAAARVLHDKFQADFPQFTQRKLDAMDEVTGVADRFRSMAREVLEAAERVRVKQLGDLFGPDVVT